MPKLSVYTSVSLDGYYADLNGDMSWAHRQDPEWNALVASNASGDGRLVFGRVTYEMMSSFWPTPMALARAPGVAERMNSLPKIAFSRTLDRATWNNTMLIKDEMVSAMRELKRAPGPDMVILGSGSVVAQLTQARLIDQYQIVVCPIALGGGKSMFSGVTPRLPLARTQARTFENGNVVLTYELADDNGASAGNGRG